MDPQTLTELLAGRHFGMEERIKRGAWPHPPLHFHDLTRHLAQVLTEQQWFPHPWHERQPHEAVADRTVIERQAPGRYVVHFERSGPAMNLAEAGDRVFHQPEEAAAFYLQAEFNLPGDLDGWKVVE
jgi:hypothetical protein